MRGREPGGRRPASLPADPLIEPEARASLLVLRPGLQDGALDPAALEIERVFVDGREPAARPSSR